MIPRRKFIVCGRGGDLIPCTGEARRWDNDIGESTACRVYQASWRRDDLN
jgi:hypothetical protein